MKKLLILFFFCAAIILAGGSIVMYKVHSAITRRSLPSEVVACALKVRQTLLAAGATKIALRTNDGLTLSGLQLIRPGAKRFFLVVHGYGQTKESYVQLSALFLQDNFLFIDLRAHGESQGNYISYGYYEALDVAASLRYIRTHFPRLPIVGIGFSMGAVALAKAVGEERSPCDALILDSAFAYLPTQIQRLFSRRTGLPQQLGGIVEYIYEWYMGFAASEVNMHYYGSKITIPTLLLQSEADRVTPVVDVYTIYRSLPENSLKRIAVWPVGKHALLLQENPHQYKKELDEFLNFAII